MSMSTGSAINALERGEFTDTILISGVEDSFFCSFSWPRAQSKSTKRREHSLRLVQFGRRLRHDGARARGGGGALERESSRCIGHGLRTCSKLGRCTTTLPFHGIPIAHSILPRADSSYQYNKSHNTCICVMPILCK